nr:hypothetical protein [Tanacetum cinerariifolium]
ESKSIALGAAATWTGETANVGGLKYSSSIGFVVHVFSLIDDPIACLNKEMVFLTAVASSRQGLLNVTTVRVKDIWLGNALSLSDQGMLYDRGVLDGQAVQTIILNNATFQTEDIDTYDSDCDDLINAQAILIANISNYSSDVISEETLILEEKSRSRMFVKEKDPEAIKQNISHKPIDYEKLNRLTEDFGECFTPQQEWSTEQAFWLRTSDPTSKPYGALHIKIEAPKELPKISLVNESLKKLKFHHATFDSVVKIRTTPNALTEGEWRFKHTKANFNNEITPFLKSLKDIFNVFDRDLLNEIIKVQTVFDQIDAAVQQSFVNKQCLEIAKKELLLENDRLLQQIMSQDVLLTVMDSISLIGDTVNMDGNRKESCNLQ